MSKGCNIMTLKEASKLLRVGKKTLANLAAAGLVPARKVGWEWRFVRPVLMDWLAHGQDLHRPCWDLKKCTKEQKDHCDFYNQIVSQQAESLTETEREVVGSGSKQA